jgi:rhamnulokinase
MTARVFGAIDIGASGGRVMAGAVHPGSGHTQLHTLHRFPNGAAMQGGHLRWNLTGLFAEVMTGLTALAAQFPEVESIGIDTWAVDYGLLDSDGHLLAEPISYRDNRTDAVIARVHDRVGQDQLYAINGLQFLPFNTLYQLEAEKASPLWDKAAHVVLLPDLLAYWLTGQLRTEATNASTTGLFDLRTGDWSQELLDLLDIPRERLPDIDQPGQVRGQVLPTVSTVTGLSTATVVTTVGSHDTASAVVAVPALGQRFGYVSSGTWSLAGLELDKPVLTAESQQANFTNEGGVDGRIRYLRNVGGLWLLQESMRSWAAEGLKFDLASLLTEAEMRPSGGPIIDVDDPGLIAPGNMPARIARAVGERGEEPPGDPAATVRCILDSLATTYARTLKQGAALAGEEIDVIHIVGGGSQNRLLCQFTADLSGLPVTSAPIEATALGNVLIQARAHGAAPASLDEIRRNLRHTQEVDGYMPSERPAGGA